MLEVQRFLRSEGATEQKLAALKSQYGIGHRRHREHPQLVLLKYNQIESPMDEAIVQECRGIILDESSNWDVVSMAFRKFFNHGEGHAAPINWATARVQEKVDGSLMVLYRYDEWRVATTGSPDAGGDVNDFSMTFEELFWKTFPESVELEALDPNCSYFFELTSPYNRIVVQQKSSSLTLLGARNKVTLQEMTPSSVAHLFPGVRVVCEFFLGSFDEIAATFGSMSPLEQEGYVVVDGSFNRVKVKHPGYVALHYAKGSMTMKALVDIARSGETSEVITAFPEFAERLQDARVLVDALVDELQRDYDRIASIETQKEFALKAVKSRLSAALFCVRAKKSESIRRYVAEMRIDQLMAVLGYKSAEEPLQQEVP
jgi:hypothetical protein